MGSLDRGHSRGEAVLWAGDDVEDERVLGAEMVGRQAGHAPMLVRNRR